MVMYANDVETNGKLPEIKIKVLFRFLVLLSNIIVKEHNEFGNAFKKEGMKATFDSMYLI